MCPHVRRVCGGHTEQPRSRPSIPSGTPKESAPAEAALVCAECGAVSPPDAAGWRAYLNVDGEAATFPACSAREFGEE
jgi:hypothetical protein